MTNLNLSDLLVPGKKAFLIGIGGVSMCPLAEELADMGLIVAGSDIQHSRQTDELISKGIPVFFGHGKGNIRSDVDFLIRTAAVKDNNPDVLEAKALGIPVFERAEAWGLIMKGYKNAVCISGTHGKTTTTSMMTHILMVSGFDPTVMVGGYLPLLGSGHRLGGGETIIMESCEYCDSFLNFSPTLAIINNIELDHLDFFQNLEQVIESFRKFAGLVPREGAIICNADDPNTMLAVSGIDRRILTFGFNEGADFRCVNPSDKDCSEFDVYHKGSFYAHVKLNVFGRHNAANALAAIAASSALGVPPDKAVQGLAGFGGADRRMEHKGYFRGAEIIDDYAHHPSELNALLEAAKTLGRDRIICVFQPHTYTRTRAMFDDFARELSKADLVILADIYAARETDNGTVSSAELASAIEGAKYLESFEEIAAFLSETAGPGDLILTVGAGDIYRVGELLLEKGANAGAETAL